MLEEVIRDTEELTLEEEEEEVDPRNFSSEHLAPSCNSCSVLGDMWGNNPLQGSNECIAIAETFLKFSDPWSIVVIIMGILGLLSVGFW